MTSQALEKRFEKHLEAIYRSVRGSNASRKASPTRLKAKTTMTSEPATIKKKLGMAVTKREALERRIPHVDAGGWIPRPKNE